ncbi:MAG TPA: ABC transporter permease [Candidatus Saccharimonadales bacterium]|nr:ABC transporter permease [Candidatus Saccharimonadales bacterium]
MNYIIKALVGTYRAELSQMTRSPLLIILAFIQAITFLLLVSLFGLTGSMAPTALINNDNGAYSQLFINNLKKAHHSFNLKSMSQDEANTLLHQGKIVAIVTIPQGFSKQITYGQTPSINVDVDNIDADMTDDIQRALPSAIVAFGNQQRFPGVRVHVEEHDLINHDTGFIPYLIVSALALDAFVIAGILSAIAIAREFEAGTFKLLKLSPIHPIVPFIGRVLAADTIAFVGMLVSVSIVIVGYKVIPIHIAEMFIALILCVLIFGFVGALVGVLLKKTLPVASLIFGLALPLYIDSGSLEPERFDGNIIWGLAHLSPIYYAVGIFEDAFHGFQVTPEPISIDFLFLIGWAALMLIIAGMLVRKQIAD